MPTCPKKLVVYLDQNFISEMSKPPDRKVRPDFRELYDVLHGGFRDEKFVVPRSDFHDIESGLAGDLRDLIRKHQSTLGHVDLERSLDIRKAVSFADPPLPRQEWRGCHFLRGRL